MSIRRRMLLGGLLTSAAVPLLGMSPQQHRILLSGKNTGPSLDLNFLSGTLDPRIAFTRGSAANYYDATGTMQQAATNVPRIDYGPTPGGATNFLVPSAAMVPAGNAWALTGGDTIAATAGWTGLAGDGFTFTEGTATQEHFLQYAFNPTDPGYQRGQNYIWSVYVQPAANTSFRLRPVLADGSADTYSSSFVLTGAGSFTGPNGSVVGGGITSVGNGWYRCWVVFTIAYNAHNVSMLLRYQDTLGNHAGSGTLQWTLSEPMLEQVASGVTTPSAYVPTTNAIATVGATPLGLLIEESRTNSIRNPRAEGAVAGTPGTLPTNWSLGGVLSGLSSQVVGSGTEAGIPYLDIRFFGTTTGSGFASVAFESATSVAASNGQAWTVSAYVRLVGGSTTGISPAIGIFQDNSSGTNVGTLQTAFTPTAAALATQRAVLATTTNQATIAAVQPFVDFGWTGAVSIDCTLRIGAPQLELGAFATSPILPPAGSPAASTRAADVAKLPVGAWFSPAAYTLDAEYVLPVATASGAFVTPAELDSGTQANALAAFCYNGKVYAALKTGSTNPISAIVAGQPVGSVTKFAFAASPGRQAATVDGAVPSTFSASTMPAAISQLLLGSAAPSGNQLNGYIRRVRYWPRALSNSELQGVTR